MFSDARLSIAVISIIFLLLLLAWSSSTATPIARQGKDSRYGFLMQVPCLGAPYGRSQVPVTEKEEVAAIAAFVEGRLPAPLFISAMMSADKRWLRPQLEQFTLICAPKRPGDNGSA
jgi:hypothetical protein